MQQRLSFLTIGVNDLEQMKNFYIEKFGWQPMKDDGGIVFFKLNGFILSLFPANELAEDIGIPQDGSGFKRVTMAINFPSEKEIDDVFADLEQKGVRIVKQPSKVFWGGYSGYVADIENNYWEFAFKPFVEFENM
ncbi:VOC family protein [Chitinophagaceae bacterium 26-R-25]|nr:VOC family protein [Chitinophagaceae bacterium 26-R-25]